MTKFVPPRITEGGLTKAIFCVTHGKVRKGGRPQDPELIESTVKYDITEQFNTIAYRRNAWLRDQIRMLEAKITVLTLRVSVLDAQIVRFKLQYQALRDNTHKVTKTATAIADENVRLREALIQIQSHFLILDDVARTYGGTTRTLDLIRQEVADALENTDA